MGEPATEPLPLGIRLELLEHESGFLDGGRALYTCEPDELASDDVELEYRWQAPGFFADALGRQLHEDMVPDVEGRAVYFRFSVDEGESVDADAIADVRTWLVDDCGALVVHFELVTRR